MIQSLGPTPRALVLALALVACGSDSGAGPPPPPPAGSGLGLDPLGSYDFPVFLTAPPNDNARVFVVEKRGTIQVVDLSSKQATEFLDLSDKVSNGGEQGLLGLAFHPDYQSNGIFVVNYTDRNGDTQVAAFRVSASNPGRADATSEHVLLTVAQPFSNHNGGMVLFGPDRQLYIGMGDGGSGGDPQGNGQGRNTLLGKMVRLSVSSTGQGSVPSDNPFVNTAGTRPEIWSLGLRNPWRFSFDRQTGDLYIGDVGQNEREEIDVVTAPNHAGRGANFGWNIMEGMACYGASSCDQSGLTQPVVEYRHSDGCSVTGGYVYRGAIAAVRGTYFYADYCGGWVRSFRLENGAATDERTWDSLAPNGQITSFGEDASGELYILTAGGPIAKIVAQP